MNMRRRAAVLILSVTMAFSMSTDVLMAAAVELMGSGTVLGGAGAAVAFSASLDGTRSGPAFTYADYSTDPARALTMTEPASAECLGELFGGQTVRLVGPAVDSAAPDESLTLQVFLIDGGESGPDRLSVKAMRIDDSVVLFAPLRDLDSGDVTVICVP